MKTTLPLHVEAPQFDVKDDCLCFGGRKVTELSKSMGGKPFYVYDKDAIEERINYLRKNVPSDISLHYAVKANPMPAVVEFISERVDGLDVASAGELAIAIEAGCNPELISFAGPGKSIDELAAAIDAGSTINVESTTELDRIVMIARETGTTPNIAIRVNPNYEMKSSGMKMSGGAKQFGIDAEVVPEVLKSLAKMPVEFTGFHIFSGSQSLMADAICDSQTNAVNLAIELSRHAPVAPRSINIGGGIGIPYFRGDQPVRLEDISKNLENVQRKLREYFPDTELVLELGRYIIGEAGVYICEILDKKVSRGEIFLITNGGLHHHLAASGNFGQVIRKNYPLLIANRVHSTDVEKASVVGPLCTPLDLLGNKMELAKAESGDLVAVFQSGAYGYTASPHYFLGHPPPSQALL